MKRIFLLVLILIPIYFFAQSKQVWIYDGDNYFEKSDYASALKFYKKAQSDSISTTQTIVPYEVVNTNQKIKENKKRKIDSTTKVTVIDYLNHQIAMCYLLIYDYKQASEHLAKTKASNGYYHDTYYYGLALMNVEQYDTAIVQFEDYMQSNNKNDSLAKLAQKHVQGCYFALSENSLRKEKRVTLADTTVFNKGKSSFGTMYWGKDKMIFASARKGGVLIDREVQDSEYLSDLYWTEKDGENSWSTAKNFGRPLNSSLHDASGMFNDNNIIFYTRWSNEKREEQNIYLAKMIEMKFFESYKLDTLINYPGCKSINPFITLDGERMYFSSNRPGGHGGMDLWEIEIDEVGKPRGPATNLGSSINTTSDEISPFFHEPSSTLFFSSNGHRGLGGLDIYKSSYDQVNELYKMPINMGAPINSSKDDAYMIWDDMFKFGYLSSDRDSCEGGHCYDIYEVENDSINVIVQGFVFDAETDEIIPNAKVKLKDIRGVFKNIDVETNDVGFYKTVLPQNAEVFMKAKKKGYFADAASIDARNLTESATLVQDFFLNKIPKREIEIPGIQYDYDSPNLRAASILILDTLSKFLELNDNISIEIRSHTDTRGPADYNLRLSDRRAASVVKYLVKLGINKDRLKSLGMGETELLEDCRKYDDCQEVSNTDCDCHQRNRRTAFKVIGEGFENVFKDE